VVSSQYYIIKIQNVSNIKKIKNVILDKNLIGNNICYRRRLLLAIGDG